jgi:hypothetical protein
MHIVHGCAALVGIPAYRDHRDDERNIVERQEM